MLHLTGIKWWIYFSCKKRWKCPQAFTFAPSNLGFGGWDNSRAQCRRSSPFTNPSLWNMIALYWLPESRACLQRVPKDGARCVYFGWEPRRNVICKWSLTAATFNLEQEWQQIHSVLLLRKSKIISFIECHKRPLVQKVFFPSCQEITALPIEGKWSTKQYLCKWKKHEYYLQIVSFASSRITNTRNTFSFFHS